MTVSFYCLGCGNMTEHVDGKCPCGKDNAHLIKMDAWYQRVNVVLDSLRKLIDEVADVK